MRFEGSIVARLDPVPTFIFSEIPIDIKKARRLERAVNIIIDIGVRAGYYQFKFHFKTIPYQKTDGPGKGLSVGAGIGRLFRNEREL